MLTKTHATFFIIGFMLYVLLMIVVGIICSKGKSKGKDYLTGGGKMPMYLIFAPWAPPLSVQARPSAQRPTGLRMVLAVLPMVWALPFGILALVLVAKKSKLRAKNLLTMAEEAQFHYNGNKMVKAVMSS